jgi:predicted RNase H-like HicB family nuclease
MRYRPSLWGGGANCLKMHGEAQPTFAFAISAAHGAARLRIGSQAWLASHLSASVASRPTDRQSSGRRIRQGQAIPSTAGTGDCGNAQARGELMAQEFGYRVVVEWSDEDRAFVARVPALPGCAAHGRSPEQATREAVVAARGIVDAMRAHKDPIPPADVISGHSGQLRLRLPRSLHQRLAHLAALDGVSLNQEMVALLAAGAGEKIVRPSALPRIAQQRRTQGREVPNSRHSPGRTGRSRTGG